MRWRAAAARRFFRAAAWSFASETARPLPYPDAHFDKVLAVHTIYFWDNPTEHLRELHRVMKSRAVCVLGFRPKEDPRAASFPETVYRFYSREVVRDLLFDVGFANIDISEPVPGLVLARAVKQSRRSDCTSAAAR